MSSQQIKDASFLFEAPDRKDNKEEESKLVHFVEAMREFTGGTYFKLKELLQRLQENPLQMESELFVKELDKVIDELAKMNLSSQYKEFEKDPDIKGYIEHDIGNLVQKVTGAANLLEFMGSELELNQKLSFLRTFEVNWPQFSLVLEDVLSRKIETQTESLPEKNGLDIEIANQALRTFEASMHRETENKLSEVGTFSGLLQEGEVLETNGALLMNSLFNVVRNACTKYVDAFPNGVRVTIYREEDRMVIRAVDNGIGLNPEQLSRNSQKFIFKKGKEKSGRGSTGLGLASVDKRLQKVDTKLTIASHRRGDPIEETYFYANDILEPREEQVLKQALEQAKCSTIFEWRIRIKQKEH